MPVYNGERYLAAAIGSVLGQTLRNLEFLIVDDGSTDESAGIAHAFAARDARVRLFRREHAGTTATLNYGIAQCRAPYVARMDADDIALPERLERQVAFLDKNPGVVAVGCWVLLLHGPDELLGVQPWPVVHGDIDGKLLQGQGGLPHPAAMIRRDLLLKVGGYRTQFRVAQDYDLWLRLSEVGRLANLAEPLLKYRIHADSISTNRQQEQRAAVRQALEEACQRRKIPCRPLQVDRSSRPASEYEAARGIAYQALRYGSRVMAREYAGLALRQRPFCWRSRLMLLLSTFPGTLLLPLARHCLEHRAHRRRNRA
jgi:GT2 family glycosyltransferase